MKTIEIFGNGFGRGVMDENVDMLYYYKNDISNPIFLGNVFPLIGRNPIEKFYEYGIIGSDIKLDYSFLQQLNQYFEKYNIFEIIPLSKHTVTFGYTLNNQKSIMFFGLSGCYSNYVTKLIDGINKIDLSKVDITDVVNFELSDEEKFFTTKKINVTDLQSNEKFFMVNKEYFINYILHILPKYLSSNMNFYLPIMSIINDDEDDISIDFRDTLVEKSNQYL